MQFLSGSSELSADVQKTLALWTPSFAGSLCIEVSIADEDGSSKQLPVELWWLTVTDEGRQRPPTTSMYDMDVNVLYSRMCTFLKSVVVLLRTVPGYRSVFVFRCSLEGAHCCVCFFFNRRLHRMALKQSEESYRVCWRAFIGAPKPERIANSRPLEVSFGFSREKTQNGRMFPFYRLDH